MKPQTYKLTVISNIKLTEKVVLVKVKSDVDLNFKAGQYFSFKIAPGIRRSYSVASKPMNNEMEFLVELIDGGIGSNFIKALREYDTFEALGPLGFFTADESAEEFIFIATGSGIAPVRSMIFDLLENKNFTKPISLYFGLRYDGEAYLHEEFTILQEEHSNFKFVPVISRPSEFWKGECGHCQDILIKEPIHQNAKIYICGNNKIVDDIKKTLIDHGYSPEQLHNEKFG
jgi:NAD(P)H-flavin reductase